MDRHKCLHSKSFCRKLFSKVPSTSASASLCGATLLKLLADGSADFRYGHDQREEGAFWTCSSEMKNKYEENCDQMVFVWLFGWTGGPRTLPRSRSVKETTARRQHLYNKLNNSCTTAKHAGRDVVSFKELDSISILTESYEIINLWTLHEYSDSVQSVLLPGCR
jgi:hypothetical protein